MAFPRVGQSAPPTPQRRDRFTFTPTHRRSKPVSVSISTTSSASESEYLSCSPTSTTSSASRVDQAVSRINSLSREQPSHDPESPRARFSQSQYDRARLSISSQVELDSPVASPLRSSTTSNTLSTGRTPTAKNVNTQRSHSPAPPLPPLATSVAEHSPHTPNRPTHRFTRSVGGFPTESEQIPLGSPTAFNKPKLPGNIAHWTPSELAQHLAYTLRTGGPDGDDPTLPPPVIEDVISWVLRSRITGAQFLQGIDAQRGTRPPPFLPVLAALSRRMRRTLRHRRSSDAFSEADVFNDSDDSDGVTRVKRLAHAFDAISSCSEASEVDDGAPTLSKLRAQITGENVTGYGRVTPKTEARMWTRRRDSSISALSSVSMADSALSGISAASAPMWRMRADSDASSSAAAVHAVEAWAQQCSIPLDPPQSPTTSKSSRPKALESQSTGESRDSSPPPPYPMEDKPERMLFPPSESAVPASPEAASRSASLTPLRVSPSHKPDPDVEAHLLRMVAHKSAGIDPYRVLRRSQAEHDTDTQRWTSNKSTRRGAAEAVAPLKERSPKRDRDVSFQVAALTERIRELEARLVAVETPATDEEHEIIATEVFEIDEDELHEVEAPHDEEDSLQGNLAGLSGLPSNVCPNCCKPGFALSDKSLNASTSTRLSSSTSSRLSASSRHSVSSRGSRTSRLTASTGAREASPATTEGTAVNEGETPEENPEKENAIGPRRISWLTLLGLVDEFGAEPRYRDLPVYLFLMGVGVGVGFSAVVVKIVLGKRQ